MSDKNEVKTVSDLIKAYGQPNFMIGIGYVRDFCEAQQKKVDELEIFKERMEFLEKRCVFLYRKLKKAGFNKEEIEKGWE